MDRAQPIRTTRRPTARRWRRSALLLSLVLGCHAGCQSVATRSTAASAARMEMKPPASPYASLAGESAKVPETTEIQPAQFRTAAPQQPPANDSNAVLSDLPGDALPARPAVPPGETESLVSLEEALSLAGADNPTIALAQEAIQTSLAERMQARALLFPTATLGFNFRVHQGNLLASPGIIRYVSSESLYGGFGANAKAAETVGIPGVRILAQLSEAAFAPRIARLRVQGRILDSAAVRNQVLLDVAERYYDLAGAEARILAMRRSEAEMAEVVRVTREFARTGQGKQADADRALSESLLLRTEAQQLDEEAAVASAQLARLLGTDPDNRLHADAEASAPISLVSENDDLSRLIQEALGNRPEVASAATAIREAETRLRQERVRPLLPLISVGFSLGTFGGGSDLAGYRFDRFDGRMDFDVLAVWSLQNLGFGNRALRNQARSEINRTFAEQNLVIDNVRREVAEAYALIADRRRELEVFRRQVKTAQSGFERELVRTKNAAGLPIEVLKSLNQLTTARQSFIQAAIAYNQAQFRLFVALGQPPSAITE